MTQAPASPALAMILAAGAATLTAHAGNDEEHFAHWAYSAYFGTGWYQVGDRQDVFVARLSPRWQLYGTRADQSVGRDVGIELRIPVTLGLHNLDTNNLGDTFDIDNVTTLSVTPGVEIDIPLTERWTLKPYVYGGWGTELNADEQAWIYWTGVKSRYTFASDFGPWSLLNAVGYLGYSADDGQSSDAVGLMAGVTQQTSAPFSLFEGSPTILHWHATYTAYLDRLTFDLGRLPDVKIDGKWEVGAAISRGENQIAFGHLRFDRIGLAYHFSDRGDFEGISLEFRSVFDR